MNPKLITLLPSAFKAISGFFAKHKEWSTKKKIAMFTALPLAVVLMAASAHFFGWDIVVLVVDKLIELLNAASEV